MVPEVVTPKDYVRAYNLSLVPNIDQGFFLGVV